LQKVEATVAIDTGTPRWGYCFTSLAEQTIRAKWKHGRKYQSREPGVTFKPVPDGPIVADKPAARKRQLRDIARNFSARILIDPRNNITQEMRLLTTPLYEYEGTDKSLKGALFGFATNGTNPDLVIVTEIRDLKGDDVWHYAPARMTTGGLTLNYSDEVVWTTEFSEPRVAEHPTWTHFSMLRESFGSK
jgi:hypothetical protein